MSIFGTIFNFILYRPLGFILSVIYLILPNYGIALLFMSLLIRAVLFPTSISTQKGMAKNARMQAKIEKLRQKYGSNKQKLQEETNALYQREGFNPMSGGCLPQLIQLPIILALYNVVYKPFTYIAYASAPLITSATTALKGLNVTSITNALKSSLQSEIVIFQNFDKIKDTVPELVPYYNKLGSGFFNFLGLDLSIKPEISSFNIIWIIPILAGLTSLLLGYMQFKVQKKQNPESARTMGCMTFSMPLISLIFAFSMPAAVGFYWICSNFAMMIQNYATSKLYPTEEMLGRILIEETIQRRSKEAMLRELKSKKEKSTVNV